MRPARAQAWFGHAEVFALLGGLSFLAARYLPVLAVPYACPVRRAFGLPCPTCGMTHAFVQLAHGHVLAALAASPAGTLLALGAWTFFAFDLARVGTGRPLPHLSQRTQRMAVVAGLVVLLGSWAFLVAREVAS